ncbi:F-box/FBD/LRR-repeat protein [Senna tora]|uniref:F-box/FBD/LRR-repeat protein n=1 Tax=Senna tora TaxID=362788 RepID=A0A834WK08_9FABA|nr:F-box/FBD/LRR-repeat protein [Senna tora]
MAESVSRRWKKDDRVVCDDRLSSLPDSLLCHILSFLPTNRAVATSILSKRWRSLWQHTPSFDLEDVRCINNQIPDEFVEAFMLSRDGPIKRFRLIDYISDFTSYNINLWINAAIRRKVEHLQIERRPTMIYMSTTVFTCETIVVMKLSNVNYMDAISSVRLPSLKILHLDVAQFCTSTDFAKLLSGCTLLEDLVINCVESQMILLDINEFAIDLPKLISANVTSHGFPHLLTALSNAKFLCYELWGCEKVYHQTPVFHNLVSLQLLFIDYSWNFLATILQNSPKLQSLILKREICYNGNDDQHFVSPGFISPHLKKCYIGKFGGTECEMQFARFIMENASLLTTFTIYCYSNLDEELQMRRKLSSFPSRPIPIPNPSTTLLSSHRHHPAPPSSLRRRLKTRYLPSSSHHCVIITHVRVPFCPSRNPLSLFFLFSPSFPFQHRPGGFTPPFSPIPTRFYHYHTLLAMAESVSKRQKIDDTVLSDRISDLPDSLLCHILFFLPTKDAVATSILSKRWRPLWCYTHAFDFDDRNYSGYEILHCRFVQFVYGFLVSRDVQPIKRLRLKCASSYASSHNIKVWVNAAIHRQVEHLEIERLPNTICLPSSTIFTCKTIVVMKLNHVNLDAISSVCLPSLKVLHLRAVQISSSSCLNKLLSGCMLLEKLVMNYVSSQSGLPIINFSVKDLPKLILADVHSCYHTNILSALSTAKFLRYDVFSYSITSDIPVFHNLTHMTLNFGYNWRFLAKILENTPKLQILILQKAKGIYYADMMHQQFVAIRFLSPYLRKCYVGGFQGKECEMQFARYILENASALSCLQLVNFVFNDQGLLAFGVVCFDDYVERQGREVEEAAFTSRFALAAIVDFSSPSFSRPHSNQSHRFHLVSVIVTIKLDRSHSVMAESVLRKWKKYDRGVSDDRLSDLPDSLLCHILSFLPTEQAVATSILSNRWRPLWQYTPSFDVDHRHSRNNQIPVQFVHAFMLSRDEPIERFRLQCCASNLTCNHNICLWIKAAIQRRVEHFKISVLPFEVSIPCGIFTSKTIVVMKLNQVNLEAISSVSLPSLKILHLRFVRFSSASCAAKLLSACRILENLVVEYVDTQDTRDILHISFPTEFPKLMSAAVHDWHYWTQSQDVQDCHRCNILRALSKVQFLCCDVGTCSYGGDIPMFHNLVHMQLYFGNYYGWKSLAKILQNSPKLQILKAAFKKQSETTTDGKYQHFVPPGFVSPLLRHCHVGGFEGTECEMQFATYILKNASLLRTFEIFGSRSLETNAKLQLLIKLHKSYSVMAESVSKGWKKDDRGVSDDRLSDLPDSLLCHILSFLPTKQVVATSILSNRWRPLWQYTPSFDFDFEDYIHTQIRQYSVQLNAFMLSRDEPINRFHLNCLSDLFSSHDDINLWIKAAIQRKVEHFHIWMLPLEFYMPCSIFTCKTIVVMKLYEVYLDAISSVSLPSLKILRLSNVKFSSASCASKLLSGCRLLEKLVVEYVYAEDPRELLHISFPTDFPKLKSAEVQYWHFWTKILGVQDSHCGNFLRAMSKVQFLSCEVGTCYYGDDFPIFHNLVHMELHFRNNYGWKNLAKIVQNSPKLQILKVFFKGDSETTTDDKYQHFVRPGFLSPFLRKCYVEGFQGNECEVQFARYIMQNASHLCTIVISGYKRLTHTKAKQQRTIKIRSKNSSKAYMGRVKDMKTFCKGVAHLCHKVRSLIGFPKDMN